MSGGVPPLVLTVRLDDTSFAYLDGLRRQHFPPERNMVPAHLTLFHALPGEHEASIARELEALCGVRRPFELRAESLRSLGRGVAVSFSSPELVTLRQELQREWRDWLTPQDSARIAPHVTIQNKVAPEQARMLLRDLGQAFRPFTATARGLYLWRYLGGPWDLARRFSFSQR